MKLSNRALAALRWEVLNINASLKNSFFPLESGELRVACLGRTGEYIAIQNLPLPDRFRPDHIDVLLLVDGFPARPPNGIYVLNKNNNALLGQLRERFNAFQDQAFHGAEAIPGYTWICYHYEGCTWRYRADTPAKGDNIGKFVGSFLAELEQ